MKSVNQLKSLARRFWHDATGCNQSLVLKQHSFGNFQQHLPQQSISFCDRDSCGLLKSLYSLKYLKQTVSFSCSLFYVKSDTEMLLYVITTRLLPSLTHTTINYFSLETSGVDLVFGALWKQLPRIKHNFFMVISLTFYDKEKQVLLIMLTNEQGNKSNATDLCVLSLFHLIITTQHTVQYNREIHSTLNRKRKSIELHRCFHLNKVTVTFIPILMTPAGFNGLSSRHLEWCGL